MKYTEIIEESVDVLKTNRLRTGLSILGIIIGIGSVIALMSLGQASQQSVKKRIESLGSNLLIIRAGNQRDGFLRGASGSATTLKYSDALAIAASNRITTVASVAGDLSGRKQVSFGRNNSNVQVVGIAGDYFKLRNITLSEGADISQADQDVTAKVAIIGPTIVTDLFNDQNPIGQSIKIGGTSFKVIGITQSKGSSGAGNQDEVIYIPLSTAQKAVFGETNVNTIYVGAKSENDMEAAQNQVGYYMLELHKKATPNDADFTIASQADLLQTATEVTKTFTMLLTGIAAISLIVGGIGIMNIMLVTVTERTTEIGLRKALGAKSKAIVIQFLTEAVVLTLAGGMLGVFAGLATSVILTKVMSLPYIISWPSIGLAVLVSSTIGIIFGWYPAFKASKLQPIEALRYE